MKHTLHSFFKYWILVCLLVPALLPVKAQYVTIPDAAFVSWLNANGYSGCLAGNQLDTACSTVVNATSVLCYGVPIKDLTGIQYFRNLTYIDCSNDSLINIPAFPPALITLNCNYNPLRTLPALPQTLQTLNCESDSLTSLPGLPQSLLKIDCPSNLLTSLPTLPASLTEIDCENNPITTLPALPASLITLNCYLNKLSVLPALPGSLMSLDCKQNYLTALPPPDTSLTYLECSYNQITALPVLPASLQTLYCDGNQLTALPALPASLRNLSCISNNITVLSALPAFLGTLACGYNRKLTVIPPLPAGLSSLSCNYDSLTVLPPLPGALLLLDCQANFLTSLPALPPALRRLDCEDNSLTSLPALPAGLTILNCFFNQLTSVPTLPDSMYQFDCSSNPNLACLPEIKTIVTFTYYATAITCLPDYGKVSFATPIFSTIPLCGLFDPTGCPVFWNISGRNYYDANGNCQFDSGDAGINNVKVILKSGGAVIQQVYCGGEGFYSFKTAYGNYTLQVDSANLPFTLQCPANDLLNTTVNAADSLSRSNDFAFKCRTGFDLGVQNIGNDYKVPRSAAVFGLDIIAGDVSQWYGAHCAAGISGQVTVTFNGPVSYVGPATGALTPVAAGNTLTYNIADFGAINNYTAFNTAFQVSNNAVVGNSICFTVSVTPTVGDYNPSNNTATYCLTIVNALDPNEKEVYPTHVDSANQWLTYTVRFQNTGTAPAVNIIVRDTLNPNLDPASFQLLAYSAKNLTQLFGNVVVFNFPNINLADSATSDSLSRGFVQYRVKTISNMQQNAVITNTASIYFDNNPPVATNTVTDTVAAPGACTPTDTTLNQTICSGDSVLFNSVYYNASGTYSETLTNAGGCDSVVNLNLAVLQSLPFTFLYDTICNGDSLLFNNIYYGRAGLDTAHFSSVNGCDSAVILNLAVNNAPASPCAHYYPMLDSVNIWQYVNVIYLVSPPPHNPNTGGSLRGLCGYPIQYNEAEFTQGDTILNSTPYKQLWASGEGFQSTTSCLIGFIREDTIAQKVYFQDVLNNPEITLYDYSLTLGDYFLLQQFNGQALVNVGPFRLDSIKEVNTNAGARRKFFFNCDTCDFLYALSFSWIEGVGNQGDMVFPYANIFSGGGGPFSGCGNNASAVQFPYNRDHIMTCFSHNNNVYFDSCLYATAVYDEPDGGVSIIDSCNYSFVSGINQISSLNSFSIYPNPASNQITLNFDVNQSDALDITLLDATGRQVLPAMHTGQLAVGTQTRQMNIEGLASGFYLVACKNASGAIYRKLVIRE